MFAKTFILFTESIIGFHWKKILFKTMIFTCIIHKCFTDANPAVSRKKWRVRGTPYQRPDRALTFFK
jgi:hypothetical protein